ncbi:MAG: Uma2 family endonuclease [Abitibacteriaceae bacterium]|nr:Uma2 family endonuclease [Abditibacteriaceae bacterium]
MTTVQVPEAKIEALYQVPENRKAEIVNGELILMSPTGDEPGYAGDEIFVALREYARRTGTGRAYGDNKGFLVQLPHRESFSPDAAFYTGPRSGMRFLQGAPVFAVEVRSEGDYGPAAERAMTQKRADYFAAGTLVVWDVDLLSEDVIRVYRASDPNHPALYRRGETAEAEPAVPGWSFSVDNLFE